MEMKQSALKTINCSIKTVALETKRPLLTDLAEIHDFVFSSLTFNFPFSISAISTSPTPPTSTSV